MTWQTVSDNIDPALREYSDTTVSAETTYEYRIRAVNAEGASDWSNVDDATTPAAPVEPIEIEGQSRTAGRSEATVGTQISLAGTSSSAGRSEATVGTAVGIAGESRTAVRSVCVIQTDVTLEGQSRTASRAAVAVGTQISLTCESQTSSRSVAEIEIPSEPISLALRDTTASRSSLDLSTLIAISLRDTTGSRADASVTVAPSIGSPWLYTRQPSRIIGGGIA